MQNSLKDLEHLRAAVQIEIDCRKAYGSIAAAHAFALPDYAGSIGVYLARNSDPPPG